jgi:hypothetical protein
MKITRKNILDFLIMIACNFLLILLLYDFMEEYQQHNILASPFLFILSICGLCIWSKKRWLRITGNVMFITPCFLTNPCQLLQFPQYILNAISQRFC